MGADHDHGTQLARAGERNRGRLLWAFVVIGVFFVVEVVAGFITNSLALLSDAGHMLTDVVGLGMALASVQLATHFDRQRHEHEHRSQHTFGLYRLEILAAFVNALLLFGVAVWVVVEAVRRIGNEPEVLARPLFVVAVLGLGANLVAFALLRGGDRQSLNLEAAYLEVLADTVGSVGVIIAAVLMEWFGWSWVDPVMGALIGVWILPRTWALGRRAVRILIQAAPPHVDLDAMASDLESIAGVVDVHDLHVWTLTSDMEAASAHLMVTAEADGHSVLDQARHTVGDRYGIGHATFQVEPENHTGCHEIDW